MIKDKKRIAISILIIILITAGSYLYEDIMKNRGVNSARIIKVTEREKVIAYISSDVLRQVMEQYADGENLSIGPSFSLAISAAGVSEFEKLEVKGKDKDEVVVLSKAAIGNDLVIYLSSDGTMNLCNKDNSINLVKAITEISIKK